MASSQSAIGNQHSSYSHLPFSRNYKDGLFRMVTKNKTADKQAMPVCPLSRCRFRKKRPYQYSSSSHRKSSFCG